MRSVAFVVVALLAPGCLGGEDDARAALVPYPHVGDVVVYEATGALLELARWENGIPLAAARAQMRIGLSAGADALDAARAIHPTFRVTTEVAEAGVFDLRSIRLVSPRHQAVVQSYHPLSQDQGVLSFDERGYPWLFGASLLIGEELAEGATFPFSIPDNLGRGQTMGGAWRVEGREAGAWHLVLEGLPGVEGELWMDGSPWPARVRLSLLDASLAPHLRSDGGHPVTMEATRTSVASEGGGSLPPRDRGATFADDPTVARAPWDGEKPPDGEPGVLRYPLAEAVAEAKLLDRPLAEWLAGADAPILYRGTFQEEAAELEGATRAHWLLQWVERGGSYHEVQVSRTFAPPLAGAPIGLPGVPRVESSGPAEPPADPNHGWFDPASVPAELVPLSEGIRIVRETFGATDVQVFLRSFTDPPGYSYFLDGGFEEGGVGRYTVVYNPATGLLEQATGPVSLRTLDR